MENQYHIKLPKVLINSVPKSGTHLLLQIILGISGMKFRKATADSFVFYADHHRYVKTITTGEVALGHLPYNLNLISEMEQQRIKHIYISRDLRDITVSYMHFIINQCPDHLIFQYFTEHLQTNEQRLQALISGIHLNESDAKKYGFSSYPTIFQLFESIFNWRGNPNICELKFEDLMKDTESQKQEILKIIDYLWSDLQSLNVKKEVLLDLMQNNINPQTSWTFRKGKIGEWRDTFTEEHKQAFKQNAGNFLIDLGYETDLNW
ncbi:sulfotransferase domain-containing protein [Bacillus thuringiensis]|uniref:sulfotransferase domain-containing protein n=1 Tax=Bacillus thuringiensis TaxID=1428 RepID=UPI00345B3250